MSKIMYHINPYTGVPGVCHAQYGNCPYGGETGRENHFNSYEEAQSVSDQIQAEKFQQYSEAETIDRNRSWDRIKQYSYLDDMSEESALREVENSKDPKLLKSVLDGKVLAKANDDPKFVQAALRNPYLDDDTIYSIINNAKDYSIDSIYAFEDNPRLTSEIRMSLSFAHPNDRNYIDLICQHKKISKEAILSVLDDLKHGNTGNWPTSVSRIVFNTNCPEKVFNEWLDDPDLYKMVNI